MFVHELDVYLLCLLTGWDTRENPGKILALSFGAPFGSFITRSAPPLSADKSQLVTRKSYTSAVK